MLNEKQNTFWLSSLFKAVELKLFLLHQDKEAKKNSSSKFQIHTIVYTIVIFRDKNKICKKAIVLRQRVSMQKISGSLPHPLPQNCPHYTQNWISSNFCPLTCNTIYTVYQVLSACIHFPLCSREYQNREKCIRVNLTQSLANQVDWAVTWISWNNLIHGFRMEFAEKNPDMRDLKMSIQSRS